MNVKKFFANTSREAWRLVREALGPDAVILSNRTVNGQVEILALPAEDMASLAEPGGDRSMRAEPALESRPSADKREEKGAAAPDPGAKGQNERPTHRFGNFLRPSPLARNAASDPPQAKETPMIDIAAAMSETRVELMGEIRSMRGMLEEQLAEIQWSGQHQRAPVKTMVLREMLAAGFSASLSRYLAEKVPANEKSETVMNWLRFVLARNLSVLGNESEMLEKGGVYALVGPTGVGKTTTTAKLAARCVMRHGAGKLALITTDGYRIGAYEQLRIYGKILGVMVHSVKDETDLRIALDELRGKHTVLIDTVGMGQRDKMVAEQIAMLSGVGTEVKRLLCLSATSNGETLNEVVRSYLGDGLAGCIMTKLDEAATIGSLLDVVIRRKLNLYYVANGQRVPEDLHVANQHYLIDRAFKLKRETAPFQLKDDELPLVMANAARGMNDKGLREVSLG
jgi:flagellar biosynthesis protein FlhF